MYLKKALHNQLQLHESITQSLGFLWNENCQQKLGIYKIQLSGEDYASWIGLRYSLWFTPGKSKPNLATWIYNEKNGAIVLEITENYFWNYLAKKDSADFMSYDEFLKENHFFLKRVIPRETISKWIVQTEQLYQLFLKNTDNLEKV